MGKKEPSKGRVWERDRRDRLNHSFSSLAKLLPEYDPSLALSKMSILEKAVKYIKELKHSNKELVIGNGGSEQAEMVKSLEKRMEELVNRNQQLANLLKVAGITPPNESGSGPALGKRPRKWTNQLSAEDVENAGGLVSRRKKKKKDKSSINTTEDTPSTSQPLSHLQPNSKAKPKQSETSKTSTTKATSSPSKSAQNPSSKKAPVNTTTTASQILSQQIILIQPPATTTMPPPPRIIPPAVFSSGSGLQQGIVMTKSLLTTPIMATGLVPFGGSALMQPPQTFILTSGQLLPVLPSIPVISPPKVRTGEVKAIAPKIGKDRVAIPMLKKTVTKQTKSCERKKKVGKESDKGGHSEKAGEVPATTEESVTSSAAAPTTTTMASQVPNIITNVTDFETTNIANVEPSGESTTSETAVSPVSSGTSLRENFAALGDHGNISTVDVLANNRTSMIAVSSVPASVTTAIGSIPSYSLTDAAMINVAHSSNSIAPVAGVADNSSVSNNTVNSVSGSMGPLVGDIRSYSVSGIGINQPISTSSIAPVASVRSRAVHSVSTSIASVGDVPNYNINESAIAKVANNITSITPIGSNPNNADANSNIPQYNMAGSAITKGTGNVDRCSSNNTGMVNMGTSRNVADIERAVSDIPRYNTTVVGIADVANRASRNLSIAEITNRSISSVASNVASISNISSYNTSQVAVRNPVSGITSVAPGSAPNSIVNNNVAEMSTSTGIGEMISNAIATVTSEVAAVSYTDTDTSANQKSTYSIAALCEITLGDKQTSWSTDKNKDAGKTKDFPQMFGTMVPKSRPDLDPPSSKMTAMEGSLPIDTPCFLDMNDDSRTSANAGLNLPLILSVGASFGDVLHLPSPKSVEAVSPTAIFLSTFPIVSSSLSKTSEVVTDSAGGLQIEQEHNKEQAYVDHALSTMESMSNKEAVSWEQSYQVNRKRNQWSVAPGRDVEKQRGTYVQNFGEKGKPAEEQFLNTPVKKNVPQPANSSASSAYNYFGPNSGGVQEDQFSYAAPSNNIASSGGAKTSFTIQTMLPNSSGPTFSAASNDAQAYSTSYSVSSIAESAHVAKDVKHVSSTLAPATHASVNCTMFSGNTPTYSSSYSLANSKENQVNFSQPWTETLKQNKMAYQDMSGSLDNMEVPSKTVYQQKPQQKAKSPVNWMTNPVTTASQYPFHLPAMNFQSRQMESSGYSAQSDNFVLDTFTSGTGFTTNQFPPKSKTGQQQWSNFLSKDSTYPAHTFVPPVDDYMEGQALEPQYASRKNEFGKAKKAKGGYGTFLSVSQLVSNPQGNAASKRNKSGPDKKADKNYMHTKTATWTNTRYTTESIVKPPPPPPVDKRMQRECHFTDKTLDNFGPPCQQTSYNPNFTYLPQATAYAPMLPNMYPSQPSTQSFSGLPPWERKQDNDNQAPKRKGTNLSTLSDANLLPYMPPPPQAVEEPTPFFQTGFYPSYPPPAPRDMMQQPTLPLANHTSAPNVVPPPVTNTGFTSNTLFPPPISHPNASSGNQSNSLTSFNLSAIFPEINDKQSMPPPPPLAPPPPSMNSIHHHHHHHHHKSSGSQPPAPLVGNGNLCAAPPSLLRTSEYRHMPSASSNCLPTHHGNINVNNLNNLLSHPPTEVGLGLNSTFPAPSLSSVVPNLSFTMHEH